MLLAKNDFDMVQYQGPYLLASRLQHGRLRKMQANLILTVSPEAAVVPSYYSVSRFGYCQPCQV